MISPNAKTFREQAGFKTGTSVYITDTNFHEDLYDETCISLIANFFMAFKENQQKQPSIKNL